MSAFLVPKSAGNGKQHVFCRASCPDRGRFVCAFVCPVRVMVLVCFFGRLFFVRHRDLSLFLSAFVYGHSASKSRPQPVRHVLFRREWLKTEEKKKLKGTKPESDETPLFSFLFFVVVRKCSCRSKTVCLRGRAETWTTRCSSATSWTWRT